VISLDATGALRAECDGARALGRSVGFVPTMGFLHEGHRSLMRAARAQNDLVVASIFVNRLQFAPSEDLGAYPRDPEGDAAAARAEGVDVLFVPSDEEMYPSSPLTTVHVDELTAGLCGASRPTFFDGVATVVTKLLAIVGPCRAYFGRKDFQQLAVVRRLVADLSLPVEVAGCPLVREPDGLAMSSRNAYLDASERAAATVLFRALEEATSGIAAGERRAGEIRSALTAMIAAEPKARIDYVAVVDATTLQPIEHLEGEVVLAVAAQVGGARLIDNMTVSIDDTTVSVDAGVLAAPA
jgi:pantoate--beta-alanine ligase